MGVKHFLKGLSWLLVLNLLIKPVWIFAIDRQVQNVVGHTAYGTYFALFNLTYVLLFIADAGLSNMLTQKLAANEALNVQQLLRLKGVMLGLYAVVCVFVAWLTGVGQWSVLLYLILVQGLTSFFLFLRSLLTARQQFGTDALFSVLDKSLLILLCAGPLYGLFRPMTIAFFLQLQTASIFIAVVSLFLLLVRKNALTTGSSFSVKQLFTWTSPFVLIILLMAAHNRLDAFLLERLRPDGARQAGIYAMAYRLLDAANMAGYLTASFLVPFLSRHQHNKALLQRVILLSRHGLLFLAAGTVAFVIIFTPWLLQLLYHTTDTYNSTVMQLCLLSLPAYYLIHVYGAALTATAQFRSFLLVLLGTVVVNVILNLALIPLYGAMGCCLAALLTQYGSGLALWWTASLRLSVSPSVSTAWWYPVAAIFCGFYFRIGQMLTQNVWIILSSIALLLFVVVALRRNVVRKIILSFYK